MTNISNYFNNSYEGESIHILRNGIEFPLSNILGGISNLPYSEDFPYPQKHWVFESTLSRTTSTDSLIIDSYENLIVRSEKIGSTENRKISIIANEFVPEPGKVMVKCVVIKIYILQPACKKDNLQILDAATGQFYPTKDTAFSTELLLRVYIHNSINEIWLSTDKLNFTRNFLTRIPLRCLARFDDGVIANLAHSYYRLDSKESFDVDFNLVGKLTFNDSETGIQMFSIDEPDLKYLILESKDAVEKTYTDILRIFIPNTSRFFSSTLNPANVNYSISLKDRDEYPLIYIGGEYSNVDSKHTFIFFDDGFNSSNKVYSSRYALQIKDFLLKSQYSYPWNLFKNCRFFYCPIPSIDSACSLNGEYVLLDTSTTQYSAANLGSYLNADSDLKKMTSIVGLPSINDIAKNLSTKTIEWRKMHGIIDNSETAITPAPPHRFKLTSETALPSNVFPITDDLFSSWKKMAYLIHFNNTETPFRSEHNANTGKLKLLVHNFDRPNFYEFVRNLKYGEEEIGKTFIDSTLKKLHNGSNTLVFSNLQATNMGGITFTPQILDTTIDDINSAKYRVIAINQLSIKEAYQNVVCQSLQNPVKGTPYFRSKLTPYFTAGIF